MDAASSDTDTKNAILIQACQSILMPQSSGYLGKDGDTDSMHNTIIEVLRKSKD
ncbi:MAG: hypothetical protein U0003_03050 [Vampirovibrionales bacterium]